MDQLTDRFDSVARQIAGQQALQALDGDIRRRSQQLANRRYTLAGEIAHAPLRPPAVIQHRQAEPVWLTLCETAGTNVGTRPEQKETIKNRLMVNVGTKG